MKREKRAIRRARKGEKPPVNIRELAIQERKERAVRAGKRLRALLEEEDCELIVQLMIGKQSVPLEQIVTLPGVVQLVPK